MVISYGYDDIKIVDVRKEHLGWDPFQQPGWRAGAIQTALPDAACPWLPRKPLDAATGQVFMLHHPGGHQDNSKQSNNKKMYHIPRPFWWPWWCAGTIPRASPDKGGSGLQRMPPVATIGQVLRLVVAIGHTYIKFQFFSLSTCYKRAQADVKAPNNNRGMTCLSDGKELNNMV